MIRVRQRDWDKAPQKARQRYEWALQHVGDRIQDVGCGTGYGAAWMASQGRDVLAIDLEPDPEANYPIKEGHWSDWLETDRDTVAMEFVEHLRKPDFFLRCCRGRIALSVPNLDNVPYDPKVWPEHYRHYTVSAIIALLESTGWGSIAISGVDRKGYCEPAKAENLLVAAEKPTS